MARKGMYDLAKLPDGVSIRLGAALMDSDKVIYEPSGAVGAALTNGHWLVQFHGMRTDKPEEGRNWQGAITNQNDVVGYDALGLETALVKEVEKVAKRCKDAPLNVQWDKRFRISAGTYDGEPQAPSIFDRVLPATGVPYVALCHFVHFTQGKDAVLQVTPDGWDIESASERWSGDYDIPAAVAVYHRSEGTCGALRVCRGRHAGPRVLRTLPDSGVSLGYLLGLLSVGLVLWRRLPKPMPRPRFIRRTVLGRQAQLDSSDSYRGPQGSGRLVEKGWLTHDAGVGDPYLLTVPLESQQHRQDVMLPVHGLVMPLRLS